MSILLTAFDLYDEWEENSSWTALTEYLKEYGVAPDIITRRYPVNFALMKERLEADLQRGVRGVIHLGQRPGTAKLHLEALCVNVAGFTKGTGSEFGSLIEGAPVAYRSQCPLGLWCDSLQRSGVPAEVSYHAGTYLCNAIMYLSHYWFAARSLNVPVVFVHTPLTIAESERTDGRFPGMQNHLLAEGVRGLVGLMRNVVTNNQLV